MMRFPPRFKTIHQLQITLSQLLPFHSEMQLLLAPLKKDEKRRVFEGEKCAFEEGVANILAKTIGHLKMVSDKTTIFANVYTSEE